MKLKQLLIPAIAIVAFWFCGSSSYAIGFVSVSEYNEMVKERNEFLRARNAAETENTHLKSELDKTKAELDQAKKKHEEEIKDIKDGIGVVSIKAFFWGIGACVSFCVLVVFGSVSYVKIRQKKDEIGTTSPHGQKSNKCPQCGAIRPDGAVKCPNPKCAIRF
jgi:hypothetical protein